MSLQEKLFPWQKKLVDGSKNRSSLGLFLDMGLGKTPISLALCEAKNIRNILVVTIATKRSEPKTLHGSWRWWAEQYSPVSLIEITNYESVYKHVKKEQSKRKSFIFKEEVERFIKRSNHFPSAIILDESHTIKNLKSNNHRVLRLLKKNTKNLQAIYCLSGTPFTRGYEEILTQLQYLGSSMTKTLFCEKFCERGNIPNLRGWQQPIVAYKNTDELLSFIHKWAITIDSEEVEDLPEKIFTEHYLEKSDEIRFFTQEKINGKLNLKYRNLGGYFADTSALFYLRTRELLSGFLGNGENYVRFGTARLDALREILKNNPDNYVIFYNFVPELYMIFPVLEELGYKIDVYSGDIKSLYFYDTFEKKDDKKRVILANFASGGVGKNWQKYSKCILFSTPLYGDYSQSIKRLHRIGTKEPVVYIKIIMENSLDEKMWAAIEKKQEYTAAMFEYDFVKRGENL